VFALLVCLAFILMEPITYLTHRFVMHGFGFFLHRSHHRRNISGWEANDWYPVMFASVVCFAMFVGANGIPALYPTGIGVTLYGAAYGIVHDIYIHRRIPLFKRELPGFNKLAERHELHHRFNGEPYGMLFPLLPKTLKARAAQVDEHSDIQSRK
jgi:beta-carotene 3-hydroxylase